MPVLTIRLDDKSRRRLGKLAQATARSKSFLAGQAIRSYLELNEWQIAETKAALREAEAGDFASDADVRRLAAQWKKRAR